ncbi:hypothetical protein HNQ39_000871 [Armatimonas rosea]|uniref:Uncharacterized protein n=1 Tax=Armatimonas rosea TaxID=685828 RepID=A0A7W9SNF7_ARMRO|nr:hypothetical protein [Armatimonas rosea]
MILQNRQLHLSLSCDCQRNLNCLRNQSEDSRLCALRESVWTSEGERAS